MIYDYAVEPELVAEWNTLADYRFFIVCFGIGQHRILSGFPKLTKWRSRALRAAEHLAEIERTRVEALIDRLTENVAVRRAPFNGALPWLDSVETEHARYPFHAIVARTNPRGASYVITTTDCVHNA